MLQSKILFFVDSNKRYKGKIINGIEVKLPDEIKEKKWIDGFLNDFASGYDSIKNDDNQTKLF